MRTGADADAAFVISSLMHEETHLFNFAFLGDRAQGWWAGEFSCVYHQERALLTRQGADVRSELARRLPHGPVGPLSSLEGPTQPAFDSALSALYFLETTYGTARMIEFRRQCLMSSKATNGKALPASVFRTVFGKDVTVLDGEWRAFFGWAKADHENENQPCPDARTDAPADWRHVDDGHAGGSGTKCSSAQAERPL